MKESSVREGREGLETNENTDTEARCAERDARNPPGPSIRFFALLWKGLKGRMEDERARARAVVGGSDDTCVE